MKTKNNNTETAAAAPEAPEDEYEYFDMVAKKYLPLREPDEQEYRHRMDNDDDPATDPAKLPPDEEAEYLRRIEEFRERRREAGLKIDPETAEVIWNRGEIGDPYGLWQGWDPLGMYPGPGPFCIGRHYFARSPGSDIWVSFDDLPDATRDALEERLNGGKRYVVPPLDDLNETPF